MDILSILYKIIFNPKEVLEGIPSIYSYIILFVIFPGDSLLFIAGFLASVQHSGNPSSILNIWILLPLLSIAAILGDNFGYYTGKKFGPRILSMKDNFIFKRKYIEETKKYYEKKGKLAIILARFVPAVRTFVPIVAGIVGMDRKGFIKYNFIGGLIWVLSMTLLGFFSGKFMEANGIDIEHYIVPVTVFIIVISIVLGYFEGKKLNKENINIDDIPV